jgi:Skp family chaperone for outer membrane proteins
MKTSLFILLMLVGFQIGGTVGRCAERSTPVVPPKAAAQDTQTVVRSTGQPAEQQMQRLQREFDQQSQSVLEKRKALLERLRKAGTDEERNKIMAELRSQQQERMEQQRELARQIREQMQNEREARRTQPPGG